MVARRERAVLVRTSRRRSRPRRRPRPNPHADQVVRREVVSGGRFPARILVAQRSDTDDQPGGDEACDERVDARLAFRNRASLVAVLPFERPRGRVEPSVSPCGTPPARQASRAPSIARRARRPFVAKALTVDGRTRTGCAMPARTGTRAGDGRAARCRGVTPSRSCRTSARADVRQLLLGVTPRQRAALLLVDLLGYPSEQASRILRVRPSTVRALATKGRRALRAMEGARDA